MAECEVRALEIDGRGFADLVTLSLACSFGFAEGRKVCERAAYAGRFLLPSLSSPTTVAAVLERNVRFEFMC